MYEKFGFILLKLNFKILKEENVVLLYKCRSMIFYSGECMYLVFRYCIMGVGRDIGILCFFLFY